MMNSAAKRVTVICLLATIFHYTHGQAPDLYYETDDVLRLNSTSFIPTVFHKNEDTTFVVQFYNTFCGHCQMFAPIYKELATRTKNWTSAVRIAAIDCSKDENLITCSDNKIRGYPTILIFPPNARADNPDDKPFDLRSEKIEWTIDDIEESIINYVSRLVDVRHPAPLVAHALQPIQAIDVGALKRIYPENTNVADGESGLQDLMLVVESDKSYLGRRLIMEYYRIHHKLELRRVLISNQQFLKSVLQEKDLARLDADQPLLIRVTSQSNPDEKDDKVLVLVRGELARVLPTSEEHERQDYVLRRFNNFFQHFYSIELKDVDTPKTESYFKPKQLVPPFNDGLRDKQRQELNLSYILQNGGLGQNRIFSIDLLKGLVYLITHEVKVKGDLTPGEVNIVRNVLTILKKYLPLEKWDPTVHSFINDLRTRFDDNRFTYEKSGITAQELRDLIDLSGGDQVRTRYEKESWISCLASDRQHKGYTCSLWLLFHSLTAGEYVKAAPVQVNPTLVLHTMRDYIINFLGCTVCSSNFKKETQSLDGSLIHRNSSIIWLWKTHNLVNQRLNNELQGAKRPLKEIIFPTERVCPQCYESTEEIGLDGKTLEDVKWNMNNIPTYLIDLYRPDRIVSPPELATLLSEAQAKLGYQVIANDGLPGVADANNSAEQGNNQGIFSTSDMSICLILYLSCIIIVIGVCVALNPKWKRFKTK